MIGLKRAYRPGRDPAPVRGGVRIKEIGAMLQKKMTMGPLIVLGALTFDVII